MPPSAVRTVNDLMYWQYAKIIADSARMGKRQWPFVMDRFKKLQSGEIAWDSIREYVKEREDTRRCIYCGKSADFTLDRLIPRALHGPQDEKNAVWVCAPCNSSKGARRLYEYWTARGGLKAAKYDVPRIAEGKCLKLLHDMFDQAGLLGLEENEIRARFCPECDLKQTCVHEGSEGRLSPLCLDGIATVILRAKSE
jgi:5-methylcytosine-specific restriction endonuclease McrA